MRREEETENEGKRERNGEMKEEWWRKMTARRKGGNETCSDNTAVCLLQRHVTLQTHTTTYQTE